MVETSDNPVTLYQEHETKGTVSFFKSGFCSTSPSLYFEARDIKWEFSHGGIPEGLDSLEGTFVYADGFFDGDKPRLLKEQQTKAGFYVVQIKVEGVQYVHITFYAPGLQDLLGQFYAKDPYGKARPSGLVGQPKEGLWGFAAKTADELNKKYLRNAPVDAFLFKRSPNLKVSSFRLVAYRHGWEFLDGRQVGSRLQGTLFYRDGFFTGENPRLPNNLGALFDASYYVDRVINKNEHFAHIKFYAPGSRDELLGEFFGNDTHDIVGNSGLLRQHRVGAWRFLKYNTISATASKKKESTLITVKLPPLNKVAEIHCNQGDKIFNEALGVEGEIIITDLKALKGDSKPVRWYKDRAIFTKHPFSSDFTAFFFPTADVNLGTEVELRWNTVSWNDIVEPKPEPEPQPEPEPGPKEES